MSLAAMIRRAVGGKGLEDERPEDDDPEKEGVDEAPAKDEDDPEDVAEDEDPEKDAEDDDPEKDAEDEDDPEKDMSASKRSAFAKGRAAERKRIGAILGSKAAEANPGLAAHLAFGTKDRAAKAVATLKAAGPSGDSRLASRMNSRQPSRLGRGGETTSRAKDAGAVWDGAFAKAGVKTKGK